MSDAPERIWAAQNKYSGATMWWPDSMATGTEYIRKDVADAMLKAERECTLDAVHKYLTDTYGASPLSSPVDRSRILALISEDKTYG